MLTLSEYADQWLAGRDRLKARTRAHYRYLLDRHILPALGSLDIAAIDMATVRRWYVALDARTPTMRAHTYSLLRTILTSAVREEVLTKAPATIVGAGSAETKHQPRPATLAEIEAIASAMPARLRAMVLLAAWCGLRFGEAAALTRDDVDLEGGRLRIERGIVRTADRQVLTTTPKSRAGRRTVAIPPHLLPMLADHLRDHAGPALLFPARNGEAVPSSTVLWHFGLARVTAGRPDIRFHDLRHVGATLAAATGATLADLMARMGHSTPAAALRYQHASADRDAAIAEALSSFAAAGRVGLKGSRTSTG